MRARFLLLIGIVLGLCPQPALATRPSNDVEAFRRFNLYSDRIQAVGTMDHVNPGGYPAFLDSEHLLVVRSPGDTVGYFWSEASDAIDLQVHATRPTALVEYALNPPRHATSIGLLSMAFNVFDGTGEFADFGKRVLTIYGVLSDGDTVQWAVDVGVQARDWLGGLVYCGGNRPYYTLPPMDTLAGVVHSDELNQQYYDFQELRLPPHKRGAKLVSVLISAGMLSHPSCFIYGGGRLHGMSTWPDFEVRDALGQPVVRQSQFTNVGHGGYMFGGTPVGTRRSTNVTACQVASQAMCYTYAGFTATVNGINTYLQQNRGYQPEQVAVVTFVSPSGDALRYTATGNAKLKVGDLFLVEHGTFTNPLATYEVTVAGRSGQATRFTAHSATIPSVGDPGRVYWNMKPRVADGMTGGQLQTIDLTESPRLAAEVESLLVRDIAVQLNVPGHFVVADGWTTSFRPDGSARGTYSIKDPFDTRNYTKLIEGKYRNSFTMARYVVPSGTLATAGAAGSGARGLGVLTSGAFRVEVTDPLGRRLMRDAGTGEGVHEIPGASIADVSSEHDNGGDVDAPLTGYDVEIPIAVDGTYFVRIFGNDGLSLTASGYDASGIFATADAADTTVGAIGNVYEIAYSGAEQSVTVTHTGTVGVRRVPPTAGILRMRQSPSRGLVEFVVSSSPSGDAIDVYDISGRRVGVAEVCAGTGEQIVAWDGRAVGCRPGVYLARLRSRANERVRFVVLH